MTDFIDDVNIVKQLKLSCEVQDKSKQQIFQAIWGWQNGIWQPLQPGGGLSYGDSYITLHGTTQDDVEKEAQIFLVIQHDGDEIEPLVATNKGLVVQKDVAAGGILSSEQGVLALGSGFKWQCDRPKITLSALSILGNIDRLASAPANHVNDQLYINTTNEHLYEYHDDISNWFDKGPTSNYAGNFDTLYLEEFSSGDPAHLDLGNLTVHGDLIVYGAFWNNNIIEALFDTPEYLTGFGETFSSNMLSKIENTLQFVGEKLGFNPSSTPTVAGLNVNAISMNNGCVVLDNQGTGNGILQFGNGNYQGMRLAQTHNGTGLSDPSVLQLQTLTDSGHTGTFTWQLGVFDVSTLFVDHISSASAGGIYYFDDLRLYGPSAGHKLYDATNSSGSNGQFLCVNGSGYPQWTSYAPTWNGGTVTGDIAIGKTNPSLGFYTSNTLYGAIAYLNGNLEIMSANGAGITLESATNVVWLGLATTGCAGLDIGNSKNNAQTPFIHFHFGRNLGSQEDYNISLINSGDTVLSFATRTTTGGFIPYTDNQYSLGTSSFRWSCVYGNILDGNIIRTVGSSAEFAFNDRSQNYWWIWYAQDHKARIYWGSGGYDVWSCDYDGNVQMGKSIGIYTGANFATLLASFGHTGVGGVATLSSNSGDLRLGAQSQHVRLGNGTGYFEPYSSNTAMLGENTNMWTYVWASYLKYDISCDPFDNVDDLALAKSYTIKKELNKVTGIERDVIDKESIKFLTDDYGFFELNKVHGFLLGCTKASALKLDEQEAKIADLLKRIEDLESAQ